jgi:hypothetical protein
MPEDAPTKTSVYGASLLSGILYCGIAVASWSAGTVRSSVEEKPYHRPIYRSYNIAIKAKLHRQPCTQQP